MPTTDDWTPAIGLRNLVLSLLLRMAICLILWCGLLTIVAPAFRSDRFVMGFWLIVVAAIPPGALIGFIMSWRLSEQVGFGGLLPAISSGILAIASIILGSLIVQMVEPFATAGELYVVDGCTGIIALACIVKIAIVNEQ